MSELTQRQYLAMFMAELDEKSRLRTAREEGLAEGREEGLAEGREEGLAEGKAELAAEIAQKMLSRKMSIPDIAELTGLDPAEIKKLQ